MINSLTNGERVEDGAYHGEQQDSAQMVEEQPVRHEVPGIQNNRWKHVQEESVRCQRRDGDAAGQEQQHSYDDTNDDQQT